MSNGIRLKAFKTTLKEHVQRKTKCISGHKKEHFSVFTSITVSYDAEFVASSLDISEMAMSLKRSKLVHNY